MIRLSLWDPMRDKKFDKKAVKEKMGVPPEKVVEFLGLTGDASDNIPGLKGAGPKTAVQLIEKYGNVEEIIKSASEIAEDKKIRNRKKISAQIELDEELLRLSRKLVEVELNTPVNLQLGDKKVELSELDSQQLFDACLRRDPDQENLKKLIEELEFASLFKNLKLKPQKPDSLKDVNYKLILKDDFATWSKEFLKQEEFAFDLETSSLDTLESEMVGLAFSWSDKEAYYIPVAHSENQAKQIKLEKVLELIKPVLENSNIKKYGQNLKYDLKVLLKYQIEVKGVSFDTMIASYLLNPDSNSHNLTKLAKEYLHSDMIEYSDVVGELNSFSEVGLKAATEYASEDAHYAWLLTKKLIKEVKKHKLDKVLRDIELPLISVLADIETYGIKLDVKLLDKMSEELDKKLKILEKKLYKLAGCEFNINSPKQLSDVLFNKLGIPTKGLKKTKTGVSTNAAVLEQLRHEYELPDHILNYRALHKLKSTYVDALPSQVSKITKRLHTHLNQTITSTGRLSSSNPNLQNIPIQSEEGRKVREAFIVDTGNVLISADYSQIELRILAHMSKDKNLIKAFKDDQDIHANTAKEILNIPDDEDLDSEQRRIGKTINFGIVYGMSSFRLARELGIPFPVANQYIEDYFSHYSNVKKYFTELEKQAEQEGFVTTLFGRKRFISAVDSTGRDKGFLKRIAINAPIQGTAADVIKLAMIQIQEQIREQKLDLKMVLQIHDELLFECPEDKAQEYLKLIKSKMEEVIKLNIPLKVDANYGSNWGEVH